MGGKEKDVAEEMCFFLYENQRIVIAEVSAEYQSPEGNYKKTSIADYISRNYQTGNTNQTEIRLFEANPDLLEQT